MSEDGDDTTEWSELPEPEPCSNPIPETLRVTVGDATYDVKLNDATQLAYAAKAALQRHLPDFKFADIPGEPRGKAADAIIYDERQLIGDVGPIVIDSVSPGVTQAPEFPYILPEAIKEGDPIRPRDLPPEQRARLIQQWREMVVYQREIWRISRETERLLNCEMEIADRIEALATWDEHYPMTDAVIEKAITMAMGTDGDDED